jgi:hypothetical protein
MSFNIPGLSVNPFEKDLVHQPRDTPASVASLNQTVLDRLLARFGQLKGSGETISGKAELILSPAPGYGKSHLIGRLFDALLGKANRVYIPPFETSSTHWQSILFLTVDELDQVMDPSRWSPGQPTQLDLFAENVLRQLLAMAMRNGTMQVVRGELNADDLEHSADFSLRNANNQPSLWVRDHFLSDLLPILKQQLAPLRMKAAEWPRMLFRYLTAADGTEVRQHCLTWFRYEPLDAEIASDLSLAKAENPVTEPVENVNVGAWARLYDLCQLSKFHYPFVFCFDQTEGYTARAELVAQFGHTIAKLLAEANNQLTVVTANQAIWDARLLPGMDVAHRDRFSSPHMLRQLSRAEGEQLIDLRLKRFSPPTEILTTFKDSKWLDSLFTGDRGWSAREFTQFCRLRWSGEKPEQIGRRPLTEIYQEYIAEFVANAHWLKFDPDVFRWLVRGPLIAGSEVVCGAISFSHGYFEFLWQQQDIAEVRFGFIREGPHHQWKKISELTLQWLEGRSGKTSKVVFFRTTELAKIPKPTWKASGPIIRKALERGLDLIYLTRDETAQLYAARDLYNEAAAGNVDGYSDAEVLDFLAKELVGWRHRIFEAAAPPVPPPPVPIVEEVDTQRLLTELRSLVKRHKFISVSEAVDLLDKRFSEASIQEYSSKLKEIEKIVHPKSTLLVWQE